MTLRRTLAAPALALALACGCSVAASGAPPSPPPRPAVDRPDAAAPSARPPVFFRCAAAAREPGTGG